MKELREWNPTDVSMQMLLLCLLYLMLNRTYLLIVTRVWDRIF